MYKPMLCQIPIVLLCGVLLMQLQRHLEAEASACMNACGRYQAKELPHGLSLLDLHCLGLDIDLKQKLCAWV